MKPQTFKHQHKSTTRIGVLAAGLAAILAVAAVPACGAQDLPVTATPKVAPPTAPAISVPKGAPGADPAFAAAAAAPALSILHGSAIPGALTSISREASVGDTLHVILGHSLFIDTKTRLRRVYVSDPSVINSVTLTPNQIVITGMNPGITSLTLLDEFGHAQSYVVSSDLDIDGLRTAMAEATRSDAVQVDGSGGRVTLSGTVDSQATADAAVKLAALYSKDVSDALVVAPIHPKQVRLQVRILEVDRTKMLQLGINLFNPGGNTNFLAATTTSQYPSTATLAPSTTGGAIGLLTTSSPLNFMLYSAKLNLGTTIEDLQNKQVLQILAEPTITTISGEKADFLSGGEFPFPMVQPGSGGTAPVVTVQFRPYGVKVEFTPVVNDDGTIRLKVAPEVSALDYSNAVSISGFTVPALSTRRADTDVELRSGQPFAISGLLDQRTTDLLSKTPGAASIPILGYLFKSKSQNRSTTELVIVVTPTVIDPLTDTSAPAEPDMPVAPMNTGAFDNSLGKTHNPQPAAPSLNPDRPPFNTQPAPVPPAAPPATAPAPGAAGSVAPMPAQPNSAAAPLSASPAPTTAAPPAAGATAPPVTIPTSDLPTRTTDRPTTTAPSPSDPATEAASTAPRPVVEIMALSHASDADAMVAALKRHGYDVAINHDSQDALLHLDVGPFADKKAAENMRRRLLLDGYNASIK